MDTTAPYVVTETAALMLRRYGFLAFQNLSQTAATFDPGEPGADVVEHIQAEAKRQRLEEPAMAKRSLVEA